jgi:hypothetical protein
MITEWFLDWFLALQEWFLGFLGTDDPPAWIGDVAAVLADVIERASGLGAWFPFALLGTVAVFLLTLWGVLWSVKGVRWVYGLTPFSGGS